MPRKDALHRLHKSLMAKRDELRKQLAMELELAQGGGPVSGDLADAALDGSQTEMHTQLTAFESRELQQIERAIRLIRQGRYGTCEVCTSKIPIARLNALPYTTVCIECRQKQERHGFRSGDDSPNWESVSDFEGKLGDRELTVRDIEVELD